LRENFEAALRQYFSSNINHETGHRHAYALAVAHWDSDEQLEVEFRFLRGEVYCCFEFGCHCSLYSSEGWKRFRSCLSAQGCNAGSIRSIKFRVVVEEGARSSYSERRYGAKPSDGYTYVDVMTEPAE